MKRIIGIMLGVGLACASQADIVKGDVIYVDFGANAAVGNYNQIYSAQMSIADTVRLSDGANTGVGFDVTAINSAANPVANITTIAGNALNTTDSSLYADGIAANDVSGARNKDTITLVFTGLNDTLTYDLTGGLAHANPANFVTLWTVEQGAVDPSATSPASAAAGYVSFSGLSSTGGQLVITLEDVGLTSETHHAAVSQLTLEAIPEPATLGMVAAFGGAVLFIRRRFML
ncbi:hypothetical protein [Pontiella sp.]|uniref:hypothetical protein n=1 Tax=Pontiella sp. TaxID=2837462 RepID=UPI00356A496B